MIITNDLVETFLKCPTKCFLRSRGEAGTGNAYAAWVRTKNDVFRIEGTKRLVAGVAPDKCAIGTQATEGSLKPAQWHLGIEFTVQSQNLQCFGHAVEQIPSAGRGRTAQFVPIRFVFRNKLNRDDKLLLAFDARVLSEEPSREVGLGKIVYGENYSILKVKTPALASDVRKLTDKIGTLLASPSPPDLVLNRHCAQCEFQNRCRQKAVEKDDLSLLSGMAEKERTDFNSKGIFTVTQLSHTFRSRRRPQGLRDKRERYHHSLKALAIREKKIHIVRSPEMKTEGTPVYIDVEGLPDRDFYYLIGVRIKAGDSVVQHSLWADSPSDEGSIWREFLSKLIEVENPVLIHYGSFETVFLKRMRQRYGAPPNGSLVAKALESPINLLSVICGQIYFPTYSNGLKDIAGWLGFKWSDQDVSGVHSISWRDSWEQTKTSLAKEKLIAYNLEDCAALELVTRAVAQACRQDIRPSSEAPQSLEIVVADNLDSKVSSWPRFRSSIDGFETINKAARWDYQRDTLYIRSDSKLKRAKRKGTRRAKRTIRISKVVVCEPLRACPRCQRKATQTFRENNEVPPRSEI
jgi:predicted RecB family nuclease